MTQELRRLPAVHRLLESPALESALERWGHTALLEACREALDDARRLIGAGDSPSTADLQEAVLAKVRSAEAEAYSAVINATGVLLHTNLGRAPMPAARQQSLLGYLALEYDVQAGQRGQRLAPLRDKIARVCGAESAVMVNNNAASLGGIVDFQVSKQFRIGYAYEYPLSEISNYTSGTHEFLLMFEVFKSKRVKSPRYF
ncbi:MAG: hypothetical protein DRJ61_15125 [Acidobacteria bacterium]|nr:MAG: hypothetical protein DRJ61_15125 [Acidobacteriota bacterium]